MDFGKELAQSLGETFGTRGPRKRETRKSKDARREAEINRVLTELQEGLNVSAETVHAAAMDPSERPALHRKLDARLDHIVRLRELLSA